MGVKATSSLSYYRLNAFGVIVLLSVLSVYNSIFIFSLFGTMESTMTMAMDDDMDMGDMDMGGMQMTYYWGPNVTVLFTSWNTEGDILYYCLTLAFLFLLAVGTEAWSVLGQKYRSKSNGTPSTSIIGSKEQNLAYLINSIFYLVKLILGYQLMLAIMTYNAGISIVIFAGAFVGNFTFARFAPSGEKASIDEIACHV